MGRKSKLTDKQWLEIEQRYNAGEPARVLGPEFGVAESAIRARFLAQKNKIKTVVNQIVETERAIKQLPISAQITARSLANDLLEISQHLASAAKYGAATAHRLSGMANEQVSQIDDAQPEKSSDVIVRVMALTKLANEAANIPLGLLKANKEAVDSINAASNFGIVAPDRNLTEIDFSKLAKQLANEV